VVGTTSSGKSTLAKQLADKIGGDFIELDALHWEPGWKEADLAVFRQRVEKATSSKPALSEVEAAWVVAGNYRVVRDIVWSKAEAIIWLDYSLPVIFWRLLTRTIRRAITKEVLWNENRETFWGHLKLWSEESLFHWLFKTYWRRKQEYPALFAEPCFSHLKIFRFESPASTNKWLSKL
jgi:adenylate kinase family enzyme